MLKRRIIPTLLWKDVGLVKGVAFNSWRRVGTVLPAVKVYNLRDVDELIIMDISATHQTRNPHYEEIKEFAGECFVPLTVGGGINKIAQIKSLLRSGADKVAINTAAYCVPGLIDEAAKEFGTQCIVASIDAKHNGRSYECYSHCGTQNMGKDPLIWAQELESRGAGEILLTSISQDGVMQGYDRDLIRSVCAAVKIPVICSGGAGNYQHMQEAFQDGADAVAAASIFHFTQSTPFEAKHYLHANNTPVRL